MRSAVVQPRHVEQRVSVLEEQMQELRELPARVAGVDLQIVQLREEMKTSFTAVRAEMRESLTAVRADIREGDQATRDFMRTLYEDALARMATIGEGRQ